MSHSDGTYHGRKNDLGIKRTLSNILFAVKQVWTVSPLYFINYFAWTMVYSPMDFISGTFLIHRIISSVENGDATQNIITFTLIIGVLNLVFNVINGYYVHIMSAGIWRRVGAALEKKLYKQATFVELGCYENPEFYDKFIKAMDEVTDRVGKVMNSINGLIWRIASLSLNTFFIFYIDPILVLFAAIPLFLGFFRKRVNRIRHEEKAVRKPIGRRMSYVSRSFYLAEYSKEMRTGNMYLRMIHEMDCCLKDYMAMLKKFGFKLAFYDFIMNFGLEVVTVLGATAYSVIRALTDGGMSIADCVVVCSSIGTVSYCVNSLITNLADFDEHAVFLEDVRSFLDYEPKIVDGNVDNIPEGENDIVLSNVSFRYEGAEKDSLQDLNLHIKAGQRIALVGLNGSGKTTLIKLLLRLYDPTSGTITYGGKDIKNYKISAYRDSFNCVFQDFGMFSMSVKENVLLRRLEDGDDELVKDSLEKSGATHKIESLRNGINTTLTREFDEHGTNLSGGEGQKVALARAFARPAPVIILDEPSSALDPKAEYEMFGNMMKAAEGKTLIFISHRLASAVDADCIFMMKDGKLCESGTHKELLEKNGEYANMFHIQAKNYASDMSEGGEDR